MLMMTTDFKKKDREKAWAPTFEFEASIQHRVMTTCYVLHNQSVAPEGPSIPPPIKKETWVAGKQEGQAGSPSYRQIG
jgi:hypothetical protein